MTKVTKKIRTDVQRRPAGEGVRREVYDAISPTPYDVSPDGQQFLMIKDNSADSNATPASIVVVQNWFGELKARVR